MPRLCFTYLAAALLIGSAGARAEVKPSNLFSDNMVLQRGREVPVWGTANDGEEVTVEINGQKAKATAKEGKWMLRLAPLTAGGPTTLTISSGSKRIDLKNVLIGEVWICSGQSNMQWPLEKTTNAEEAISAASNEKIRLFTVPRKTTPEPQSEVDGTWVTCTPETARGFSAVGYYFGKALEKALGVPVGLINTSYGGTPAEAWTSKETLSNDPALAPTLGYVPDVKNAHRATGLYNAMIAPLVPYAIAGAIWYQGESNAGRAYEYHQLFPAMIQDWRSHWGQGDFPFFLVQLAPFKKIKEEPGESDWAELREAQRLTTHRLPNTGMAVITDVGEEDDIHPQQKAPVGERLALAARGIAYGEEITFSGPEYRSLRIDGNKAIVQFDHVGKGLVAKDGPLTGFTIAGADGKFHKADAEIQGNEVVVTSKEVPHPVAVRFGWADYPVVNLWNADGLPATPFRTDHFPMITRTAKR